MQAVKASSVLTVVVLLLCAGYFLPGSCYPAKFPRHDIQQLFDVYGSRRSFGPDAFTGGFGDFSPMKKWSPSSSGFKNKSYWSKSSNRGGGGNPWITHERRGFHDDPFNNGFGSFSPVKK